MEFKHTTDPFELELINVMGTDLTIVNAARISFGKRQNNPLTESDKKLINYLAREQHYSPFRHCMLQFRIRAPEFVMRQAYKHVVGCEWTSVHPTKDHAWNEVSGRYKPYDTMYVPKVWYNQHSKAKQCSGEPLSSSSQGIVHTIYDKCMETIQSSYKKLLEMGVAREQARMVLPMTIMTEVIWTASLQAVFHFIMLRDSPHAQEEIRLLARAIRCILAEKFPHALEALERAHTSGSS